jgi:hypothetical protein
MKGSRQKGFDFNDYLQKIKRKPVDNITDRIFTAEEFQQDTSERKEVEAMLEAMMVCQTSNKGADGFDSSTYEERALLELSNHFGFSFGGKKVISQKQRLQQYLLSKPGIRHADITVLMINE